MSELLRMEHISKRFGDFYANKDISLTVNRGEVLTLLGENGALSAGAINTELVPAEKVEKYNAYLQQMMDGTFMK